MDDELAALKQRHRETWAAGNYDAMAEAIWGVGAVVVAAAQTTADAEVLDVATGTGNAAIRAALNGSKVVGLDLTPELLEDARRRASESGVQVEWIEGDVERMPFEDDRFDAVLSTFGCMFAPRQRVAAAEMARVCRPEGKIAMCNWTPEGWVGRFLALMASHVPPPPAMKSSPLLWGTEDHVGKLFAPWGVEFTFLRREIRLAFGSVDEMLAAYEENFGPVVMARRALEPEGRWAAVREELRDLIADGHAGGPGARVPAEYLLAVGTKAEA